MWCISSYMFFPASTVGLHLKDRRHFFSQVNQIIDRNCIIHVLIKTMRAAAMAGLEVMAGEQAITGIGRAIHSQSELKSWSYSFDHCWADISRLFSIFSSPSLFSCCCVADGECECVSASIFHKVQAFWIIESIHFPLSVASQPLQSQRRGAKWASEEKKDIRSTEKFECTDWRARNHWPDQDLRPKSPYRWSKAGQGEFIHFKHRCLFPKQEHGSHSDTRTLSQYQYLIRWEFMRKKGGGWRDSFSTREDSEGSPPSSSCSGSSNDIVLVNVFRSCSQVLLWR